MSDANLVVSIVGGSIAIVGAILGATIQFTRHMTKMELRLASLEVTVQELQRLIASVRRRTTREIES